MSQYIHHVPGRIRVRSKAFHCRSRKTRTAESRLLALTGVRQVRVNPHAGSITVYYDSALLKQSDLLCVLEQSGCLGTTSHGGEVLHKAGEMFGKALVGAVVQKAVEQSARTLVGALI
ncbi:MAG: heavy-metal-associated domain-containing protein [Candidatus Thiosymbion ectosymbiont of Robbea hypermnestra]|nr:heavy-metal-associated domain-containing protein [Candidatus Thiosymbion ectosymbiont of Robbea hypermnestra]